MRETTAGETTPDRHSCNERDVQEQAMVGEREITLAEFRRERQREREIDKRGRAIRKRESSTRSGENLD